MLYQIILGRIRFAAADVRTSEFTIRKRRTRSRRCIHRRGHSHQRQFFPGDDIRLFVLDLVVMFEMIFEGVFGKELFGTVGDGAFYGFVFGRANVALQFLDAGSGDCHGLSSSKDFEVRNARRSPP